MALKVDDLDRRLAVQDICVSYAVALDTRDWGWLRRLFLPAAVAEYGGELGSRQGYESIEAACQAALLPLTSSQHLMGNHLVTLRGGGDADAVCYFQATHVKAGAPGGDFYTVAGRYDDHLVADGDAWRIARKVLTVMWTHGNPAVLMSGQDLQPK